MLELSLLCLLCIWMVSYVWMSFGRGSEVWSISQSTTRLIPSRKATPQRVHFNSLLNKALLDVGQQRGGQATPDEALDDPTLNICLFTADVPFTPTNGGTATAYYLLGRHLATMPNVRVTLVGVQVTDPHISSHDCAPNVRTALAAVGVQYECLTQVDVRDNEGRDLVALTGWDRLALGVVHWMDRNSARCHVIHGHEWAGVNALLSLVLHLDPQRYPTMVHLMIQSHGGHMWSQIGSPERPVDMAALRIDEAERVSVEYADTVLSPSRYMLGYFSTRGWHLPFRSTLANIVEGAANQSLTGARKAVWRLCFLGRLEERKGIKLFWDVVVKLSESRYWESHPGTRAPDVLIFGTRAVIDDVPSDEWLNTQLHARQWSFPVRVHVGLNRSTVLSRVQEDGVLLVLPSLQENLPYVLAEAAVLDVPTVTFDVGGSREVLQLAADDALTMCNETTAECLHNHVETILVNGSHYTPRLSVAMRSAEKQWIHWHKAYKKVRQQLIRERKLLLDTELSSMANDVTTGRLQIVRLPVQSHVSTAELLNSVCAQEELLPGTVADEPDSSVTELTLLMPDQFEVLPSLLTTVNHTLTRLFTGFADTKADLSDIGAITFGVQLDNASISYASAPTWILYGPDGRHCDQQFPVLVRRHLLCQAFAVDEQAFPLYEPWLLVDVLNQQRYKAITYPDVLFRYREGFSMYRMAESSSCQIWAAPSRRYQDAVMLDHMHRDVSEDMRDTYFPRTRTRQVYTDFVSALRTPIVRVADQMWSFTDGSLSQWKAGAVLDGGTIQWFHWIAQQQRFGCDNSTDFPFPQVGSNSVAHPCVSAEGWCCGHSTKAYSLVRYTFSEDQTMRGTNMLIRVIYESDPSCGDGVVLRLLYAHNAQSVPRQLLSVHIKLVDGEPSSIRRTSQQVELVDFKASSWVDVIIDPLDSQFCDGVYLNVQMSH